MTSVDVAIVGAGPSGLAAAVELRRLGVANVLVIDRESEPGGMPRHCVHTGFGWFDLRGMWSGPDYARERATLARDAGVTIRPGTTVLGWAGRRALATTSARGLATVEARAVLLATGCRERPRAARLVPGSRPLGVLTTGSLQQLVYGQKQKPGQRAVVVGAEHVSFSAVHTLQDAGVEVAAIVTELPAHQTVPLAAWWLASRRGIPIHVASTIAAIRGKTRVSAVEVARGGELETIACDTVVFTGDWIPDHELARAGDVAIDPRTRGPEVDTSLRTSVPGVFASGNLLRGAEIADVAALEGVASARHIKDWLANGTWEDAGAVACDVAPPLAWVCPNRIGPGRESPPRGCFVLRASAFVERARIEVTADGNVIHAERKARLVPNRPIEVDASWLRALPGDAHRVTFRIADGGA